MNVFHKGDPSDIRRARVLAEDIFGKGWEAKGADVYKEGIQKAQIIGCGNCHVS
jgi:alpha-mannosidase